MWNLRYAVALGILIAILAGASRIQAQETPIGPSSPWCKWPPLTTCQARWSVT